ncbi:MAG: OmpH family outer membrane protein [Deltaproteobacteria bacterium]|nr:MAG: OmpH family outer membrane protein [Deltaproteobacteria bacterium]
MKLLLVWCFGLLSFAWPVHAANAYKAGYVDLSIALNTVSEGVLAKKRLRQSKQQYQNRLIQQQRELRKEKQIFDEQIASGVLKGAERLRAQQRIQLKFAQLQQMFNQLKKKLALEEAKATKQIFQKMQGIIRAIAIRHKLDFMFEKKESSLLFAQAKHNYTKELIRRYEEKYGKKAKKAIQAPFFFPEPKPKSPRKRPSAPGRLKRSQ